MASRQNIAAAGRHLYPRYLISLLAIARLSCTRELDKPADAIGRDADNVAPLGRVQLLNTYHITRYIAYLYPPCVSPCPASFT